MGWGDGYSFCFAIGRSELIALFVLIRLFSLGLQCLRWWKNIASDGRPISLLKDSMIQLCCVVQLRGWVGVGVGIAIDDDRGKNR